jgi:hypothetical protein
MMVLVPTLMNALKELITVTLMQPVPIELDHLIAHVTMDGVVMVLPVWTLTSVKLCSDEPLEVLTLVTKMLHAPTLMATILVLATLVTLETVSLATILMNVMTLILVPMLLTALVLITMEALFALVTADMSKILMVNVTISTNVRLSNAKPMLSALISQAASNVYAITATL